jgi:hypothetical protein
MTSAFADRNRRGTAAAGRALAVGTTPELAWPIETCWHSNPREEQAKIMRIVTKTWRTPRAADGLAPLAASFGPPDEL